MNEEIIKVYPESGQKVVSLVKNDNYGGVCIKKSTKRYIIDSKNKKRNYNMIVICME